MNSTNFILFNFIFYRQNSMVMPKAYNDHFSHKKHEILQTGIYSSKEPVKSMDLTRITRISSIFRLQGPIPAPSQTKNIQQAEFRATPAIAHSLPFKHNKIILSFEVFSTRKAGTQCQNRGIKIISPKFEPKLIHFSILDIRMQHTDTLQTADPRISSELSRPHLLGPPK